MDNCSEHNALVDNFVLDMPSTGARHLTIAWLLLSYGALVIGGLFTILIVLSRTPYFQEIVPFVDFFHTALVVHVDLTVLVWFLGFAGVLWSLNSSIRCLKCGWLALALSVLGTLVITAAPFIGDGKPLMNNYIPVLQHPVFLAGLGLFGLGFTLLVLNGLFFSNAVKSKMSGDGALRFGLYTGLIAGLFSVFILILSYLDMPSFAESAYYYELLFWDAGHTLQFMHIALMLVSWLWLATVAGVSLKLSPRVALFVFLIGLIPIIMTPFVYTMFDLGMAMHKHAISLVMRYGGGLAAFPIGLIIVVGLLSSKRKYLKVGPEFNALVFSIILFAVGGIIGTGKAATWQPVIYGCGQLLHITGLVWSGGYGVQRKTAGLDQGLDGMERVISMGVMGLGGGIAVIGGIMFLVKSMWPKK